MSICCFLDLLNFLVDLIVQIKLRKKKVIDHLDEACFFYENQKEKMRMKLIYWDQNRLFSGLES